MLVHQTLSALVEVWTRRRRGALEERILLGGRAIAKIGMRGRRNDLARSADDHRASLVLELLQPFREQRDVARADLKQAVATERTSTSALQALRLRRGHVAKEFVRVLEDADIRFR
jgi:hypothetical protein